MKLSTSRTLSGEGAARGLQKFGSALVQHLVDHYNVKLVAKNEKSDIHLTIIHGPRKVGAKNVVRLDGVYYDIKRLKQNLPIRQCIYQSDGVIYQSNWCKLFVENMLHIRSPKSVVIYNGANTDAIQQSSRYDHKFDKAFVACANWRINKRLQSIVSSFIKATQLANANWGLLVIGKPDCDISHKRVKYLGKITENLYSIYKAADYMCHICHIDACPNSVVEGLCSGLPVLCNNIGGTPEIVRDSGISLPLDRPFDFSPIGNMAEVGPSVVDEEILTQGMLDIAAKDWVISRLDLDIKVSAKKYFEFFKKILGS